MVFRLRMIFREKVNIMCNLGEGLAINYMKQGWEKGLRKGMKEGVERVCNKGRKRIKNQLFGICMQMVFQWRI